MSDSGALDVVALVGRLAARGETVASAESLTGGLVSAALTDVPGSSAVVRGGVVAYIAGVKASVLGVQEALLARAGAVDADVAEQMATGVRALFGATWGLATTGVAGPEVSEGKPVGAVYVAVAGPSSVRTRALTLTGDRAAIRESSVQAVLSLLVEALCVRAGEDSA